MRYPGEVWFLPPEARPGGDLKGRRHVLLTACADADDVGIMAYASTQPTEAEYGAAYVRLDPATTGYGRRGFTGFLRTTYVYPSRLIPARSEDFQRMAGRIIDEMPELRLALRHALGLGAGSSDGVGAAADSWRGRVVSLTAALQQEIGFGYGIIVTEPTYSNAERYQLFVPIDSLAEFEPRDGDVVILRAGGSSVMSFPTDGVLTAVPEVQSLFHPTELKGWTEADRLGSRRTVWSLTAKCRNLPLVQMNEARRTNGAPGLEVDQCSREDSNLHGLAPTGS